MLIYAKRCIFIIKQQKNIRIRKEVKSENTGADTERMWLLCFYVYGKKAVTMRFDFNRKWISAVGILLFGILLFSVISLKGSKTSKVVEMDTQITEARESILSTEDNGALQKQKETNPENNDTSQQQKEPENSTTKEDIKTGNDASDNDNKISNFDNGNSQNDNMDIPNDTSISRDPYETDIITNDDNEDDSHNTDSSNMQTIPDKNNSDNQSEDDADNSNNAEKSSEDNSSDNTSSNDGVIELPIIPID